MHLRSLENKQNSVDSKQQSTASMASTTPVVATVHGAEQVESCSSSIIDLKSYRAGFQTCCVDLEQFLNQEDIKPITKVRLLHHLQLRFDMQQKTFVGNSIPAADININPTRLGTLMLNQSQLQS